jgi:hypothetical protein
VTNDRFELTPLGTLGESSDDHVAQPATERTCELPGPICPAGQLEDCPCAGSADRLVLDKRGCQLATSGDSVGEHEGVLDRLGGALSYAGGGRVRRVAKENDAPGAPALGRFEVVDVVAQDVVSSAASATAAIGSCQPENRSRISAFRPPGSSGSSSGAFFVANQYVRPPPISTRPNRSPAPHDSLRRPGSISTGETPRQAV